MNIKTTQIPNDLQKKERVQSVTYRRVTQMQMERRPCTQQIAPVQLNCHANQKGTNMRGRGENCKCFSNAF